MKALTAILLSLTAIVIIVLGWTVYSASQPKKATPIKPVATESKSTLPQSKSANEASKPTGDELFRLTNIEREKLGLKAFERNPLLDKSAQMKADELNREGWDAEPHVSDSGKHGGTYANDIGAQCKLVSENLAIGHYAFVIMQSWKTSKPHWDALISPNYESIGFAVSKSENSWYAVAHFCDSI